MEKKHMLEFINYGINNNITVKQMAKTNLGTSIFYLIGIIYGFILEYPNSILSILMMLITLSLNIFTLIKSKQDSLKNKLTIMAVISLEATVNFILFALILCNILMLSLLQKILVILIPICCSLIYFYITKHAIRNGYFLNKNKCEKNKLIIYSMLGGMAGILMARIFIKDVSQLTTVKIGIICTVFLAACFSLGMINFLKLYYIKKMNL